MSSPSAAGPKLMVLVAHPDDETFGCGSLLLHAAARGARTIVVCATRGESGELAPGVTAPAGIGALREAELREAAAALGVAEVHLLGFHDSGMSGDPAPDSLCGAALDHVTATVRAAVDRHRPDIVVTLDGSDGHRDHQRLREAAQRALRDSPTVLYLQCLPRSLMREWVRHFSTDVDAAAYTELPDIGTPDEQLTTVVDSSEHLTARQAAIALHRSQESPFDGLPDDLRRRFLGREHLIRVNPPWPGGPTEDELTGIPSHDSTERHTP